MDLHNSQLKAEAERIHLTAAEKAALRTRLFAAMAAHPAPGAASPYLFSYFHMSRVASFALAAVVLLVLGGGGTVYAAQGALPGDLLYPVKISVSEPVEVALAATPAQKAQVEVSLAERRLQEAQALAAKGALTATTSQELSANFDTHARAATALAQTVATEDPSTAVQISTELSSSAMANGAVLASIGDESKDDTTRLHASILAEHVLSANLGATLASSTLAMVEGEHGHVLRSALLQRPASTTAGLAATTSATTTATSTGTTSPATEGKGSSNAQQQVALRLEQLAAMQLQNAQTEWGSIKGSIDATTTAQVDAQFASLNTLMSDGSTALGAGQYDVALTTFKSALQSALVLRTFLHAGQTVSPRILQPLLSGEDTEK